MAAKKNSPFIIGLALTVIGIILLLQALNIASIAQKWWLPIILILVGAMVIMNIKKGIVNILGWICLIYGAVLLLMAFNLFQIAFLWRLTPAFWLLFGFILLL
ncbi:hypothetical protein ACFLRB_04740 [Acidobacteriota bacterium]